MDWPLDTNTTILLLGQAFTAGVLWTAITLNLKWLRRDLNGTVKDVQQLVETNREHEQWAHQQVKEFSDRVAHLEGKG